MTRRTLFAAAAAAAALQPARAAGGRLKQSVARWCFAKTPLDDLCREAARMGIKGIDLVKPEDWPTIRKHGLVPTMTSGAGTIPNGWNRVANHDKLEQDMRVNLERAAANGVPNVITFSGNRAGQPDDEGLANCVAGLNRVKRFAEEKGVTINLELLNSKVDHKDYQCDRSAWGAEVCRRVDSPRVKLLFDIYHMQIMEGDVIRNLRDHFRFIGHFHTGGNPGRHELDDTQELNWRAIAKAVADLGFTGYYAHEFIPVREPLKSLEEAVRLSEV